MPVIGKSDWRILLSWVHFRRCLILVFAYGGQAWVGVGYIYSFNVYFFQQAGLENRFLANTVVSLVSCRRECEESRRVMSSPILAMNGTAVSNFATRSRIDIIMDRAQTRVSLISSRLV